MEVTEPLVRCNLDGKGSTKDQLRLRNNGRISPSDIQDDNGLSDEMVGLSLSYGEEVNLNTEGDARFVTFLFANLKSFLEQTIDGQSNEEKSRLEEHIANGNSSKQKMFNSLRGRSGNGSDMHSRRLMNVSRHNNFEYGFARFDKASKVDKDELIDAISGRNLKMKNNDRSDFEINQMINFVKGRYARKLVGGSLKDLPMFNDAKFHGVSAEKPDDGDIIRDRMTSKKVMKIGRNLQQISEGLRYSPNFSIGQANVSNLQVVNTKNLNLANNQLEFTNMMSKQLIAHQTNIIRLKKEAIARRLNTQDLAVSENIEPLSDKIDLTNLDENDNDNTEKIALLEHQMSQKLSKLFNKKKALNKEQMVKKSSDCLMFRIDDSLKYDMFEGMGKTGFRKIVFEELKI